MNLTLSNYPTLLAEEQLSWRSARWFKREWTLYRGQPTENQPLARLCQEGFFQTKMQVLLAGVDSSFPPLFSFRPYGTLNRRVEVASSDLNLPLPAQVDRLMGKMTLSLANGRVYRWQPVNFWRTQWQVTPAGEFPILTARYSMWRMLGEITPHQNDLPPAELWLVVCLTCLKMITQARAAQGASGG